ncbi:MAG TPA: tetraacyldisaccharide 4'-kinase [Acidobacteriaceae bacterium]|nr:tetraacyldisaccharide 4'-kinase [Acidobacteriaceae bacterium]
MSRALLPLVPLYAAAVSAKNLAYARGWSHPHRLRNPVVSIGNLSVGGSGKTPLTIRLAELLREQGIAVDVLSRGYGRRSQEVLQVNTAGPWVDFGDEPLLIAQQAQVPVYVAPSRYEAGLLAERHSPAPAVHLLDDGFQHRQLARDVDIVVLHRSDFTTRLLPAGRLREPLASLARAHILVLRAEDRDLESQLRLRGIHQPIWWVHRQLEVPAIHQVVAFCAIARPDEFFDGLRSHGLSLAATRSWRDHHRFTSADIAELTELQRVHGAEAFLTTGKDLIRLSPDQRRALESAAPLHAVRLTARLDDEPSAIAQLLALLTPAATPKTR